MVFTHVQTTALHVALIVAFCSIRQHACKALTAAAIVHYCFIVVDNNMQLHLACTAVALVLDPPA